MADKNRTPLATYVATMIEFNCATHPMYDTFRAHITAYFLPGRPELEKGVEVYNNCAETARRYVGPRTGETIRLNQGNLSITDSLVANESGLRTRVVQIVNGSPESPQRFFGRDIQEIEDRAIRNRDVCLLVYSNEL